MVSKRRVVGREMKKFEGLKGEKMRMVDFPGYSVPFKVITDFSDDNISVQFSVQYW